ncbi:hypothetical protein GCM10007940_04450 [Portibacter lacus]|uniref:Uncharacterized protein n=2 Tax=Portibacter lacus TaxID=1099794 RepID=A0AA37SQK1_9BACT|nr:hypothetical protein GCM10007940_04450 [Portibacter lacus]
MHPVSKLFVLLLLMTIAMSSCDRNQIVIICDSEDPITDLEWLNKEYLAIKDYPEINGIFAFKYDGQTIIEVQNSLYSSTNRSQFQCDGSLIDFQSDQTKFKDYLAHRKEIKKLFGTSIWH